MTASRLLFCDCRPWWAYFVSVLGEPNKDHLNGDDDDDEDDG